VPGVQNTGTLELQGRVIRLFGVKGARGRAARELRRYLGRREVVCEPAGSGNEYRCRVDDQDLSRVVLFNGGGRATANATPELRALANKRVQPAWASGAEEVTMMIELPAGGSDWCE
jgi:penicillin-binding protein 1A